MRVGVMWKALRRAVYETEGFYLRLSDDASPAQEVLLFFPHGVVALLVILGIIGFSLTSSRRVRP